MSPLIVSSSDEDPELPLKDLRFGPLTRGSPRSVEDLNYRASKLSQAVKDRDKKKRQVKSGSGHLIQTVILRMADRNVSEAVDTVRRAVFSVDASIEQGPRNTGFLVTCQFDQVCGIYLSNSNLRHLLGAAPARNPQPEPVHAPLSAHEDC
ncbi:unnamed protein product, partial [Fusarium graminearum]